MYEEKTACKLLEEKIAVEGDRFMLREQRYEP